MSHVCATQEVGVSATDDILPYRWKVEQQTEGFTATHGNCTTAVSFKPFRVDFLVHKELAVSVNARGLLNFEHYREKK